MVHNSTSGGHGHPSRPMSPEYMFAADTAAPRLSQANSGNRFKNKDSDTTELASRFGAVTPTRLVLDSGLVAGSPSTSPGDNIQEGLGSLNRWSQSTASSKGSLEYDSYRREISSKASIDDDYTSPKGRASERNAIPHFSPLAAAPLNDESPLQGHHSPHSIPTGHYTRVLELEDHSKLSAFSTNVIDAAPSQRDHLPLGPTSIAAGLFQNPWSRSGSDEQVVNQSSQMFTDREQIHGKRRRGHSQKAMLSKALQKANTAVLLDNAANFEGAMEAYNDACQLLQLVMLRSSGGEDERSKLQEIRDTYMIRVTELQRMDFSFTEPNSKALPERPLSQESYSEMFQSIEEDDNEATLNESGNSLQCSSDHYQPVLDETRVIDSNQLPARRQSLLPSAIDDDLRRLTISPPATKQNDFSLTESTRSSRDEHLEMAMHSGPGQAARTLAVDDDSAHRLRYNDWALLSSHAKDTYESTSWLDTIDESGASSPTSTHSKVSSVYLRHGGSHHFSHGTEAEFDAALDAAVEAAYDEGFEPVTDLNEQYDGVIDNDNEIVVNARRNIELAKQKVREAELEAQVAMARGREVRHLQQPSIIDHSYAVDLDYLDEEAEEEERLLEEMTRGYIMDDFNFDLQSKSALPRQSDSSSFSGRAWESSVVSNTTTPGATLPPLTEDSVLPVVNAMAKHAAEPLSTQANAPDTLPKPSPVPTPGPSVRARRMSGQRATELKIETKPPLGTDSDISSQGQLSEPAALRPPPPLPKDEPSANFPMQASKTLGPTPALRSAVRLNKRNTSIGSFSEDIWTNSSLDKPTTREEDNNLGVSKMPSPTRPIGKVPSAPDNLGKLNSGSKSFRARNVSVPGPDTLIDSPDTPSSAFPAFDIQKGAGVAGPVLPTPTGATFAPNGLPSGGLYLFDSHIHSPTNLGSPNATVTNAPAPLEHCPESFLLRPFWLMRCIYQTIAHPSGGYLTTKLFIPRDVWRVKNVKIKAVEEKVSNCDLLTAALLKLAKVDTYDADAVLEEMQSLEIVLDQVQSSLSKKLSGEVGVQGAMALFKASQSSDDAATVDTLPSKTSSGTSKSYLTSWRKLRSKNSGFGATPQPSVKETSRDNLVINSLPMSSTPNYQPVKRNTKQLQFNGPNANYMSALARLCDAAQVLDQIAQQVEDPGLKHSSPTLVGLELSTRHAAEFFGFYICRFALNDIAMMVDKFIKRGSEWVLI
ncbi:hypothetical protein BDV26DRAFT_165903 [Aspergillus bertholletiae]|uniref:MIT domain-containing protein n=1 Tax=Aspergillus bertholletiae TaxID=1226010 RepID=A0A5N7BCN8_9EURO|nr:hypothetical protein BDV26DRAFT_165903 [Aspergillus bertholletiae]